MYYFTHGPAIAAVEDIEQARKYRDAGWRLVSYEVFRAVWEKRDLAQLAAMQSKTETAPLKGIKP